MNEIIERFKKLSIGNICDANGKGGNMDSSIKPIDKGSKIAGYAYTVKCHPGDNLAIHKAIAEAPKGSILVVDARGYCGGGHFGEIMALACMMRGIEGLVIDGAVRDTSEIEELGFPVFARGYNPGGTVKKSAGTTGKPIICGGVTVRCNDMVIGDRDGVAIVEQEKIQEVLEKAEAIAKNEINVRELLKKNKTTIQIYQFENLLKND